MKKVFRVPYVLNGMLPQTEDALLHGQLQESQTSADGSTCRVWGNRLYTVCITVSGG